MYLWKKISTPLAPDPKGEIRDRLVNNKALSITQTKMDVLETSEKQELEIYLTKEVARRSLTLTPEIS